MINNSSNPKFIKDSEQRRPIAKLEFNQKTTNSESQNQQQSANTAFSTSIWDKMGTVSKVG
jgi:hypothetical protein